MSTYLASDLPAPFFVSTKSDTFQKRKKKKIRGATHLITHAYITIKLLEYYQLLSSILPNKHTQTTTTTS